METSRNTPPNTQKTNEFPARKHRANKSTKEKGSGACLSQSLKGAKTRDVKGGQQMKLGQCSLRDVQGSVPGAINMPLQELDWRVNEVHGQRIGSASVAKKIFYDHFAFGLARQH